ncbi:NAD-dependent epimerase/dehydratase family protein [Roseateles chitinivorans]|uniref:NAD-dependent epimerase/dehydratase family protein n=1 Tax=Roseateles chitinivorans TaxID=2917965 RepID=UPI003D66E28F
MKLLLLGASGLVGGHALKLALADEAISEVIAPTRKPLPPTAKLVNPVCPQLDDFVPMLASYEPQAVICALGTTQAKAGSKEAFRHVDHELPVAFGRAAHAAGVEAFALVSAVGASADSRFFYTKTKGEVERDIQAIGFRSLTICRPSLIGGERNETRRAEHAAMALIRVLTPVLPKRFRINPASSIAAALLQAVIEATPGLRLISSDEMN